MTGVTRDVVKYQFCAALRHFDINKQQVILDDTSSFVFCHTRACHLLPLLVLVTNEKHGPKQICFLGVSEN